jgi:mRNA-degrading endonuclease toxin of MazEF toxin-antitoxin module
MDKTSGAYGFAGVVAHPVLLQGDHFCLVVSPKAFNQRFKLAMVCPISGGTAQVARDTGFLIPLLGTGLKTDGSIHAHQGGTAPNGKNCTTF